MRTSRLPGLAGGCSAVTAWTNRFNSAVGIRACGASATLSIASRSFGVRSPVQRRDVQDRRVVQELHLLPQLVVELFREVLAAPLHQVPLVGGDDRRRSRPSRPPRRSSRPGRSRPSTASMMRTATSACVDGAPGDEHADRLDLRRPRATRPARRMPAVSTMRNFRLCHLSMASTVSRVVPGMSLTIDRSSRSNRFTQRRLADVRPADDRDRGLSGFAAAPAAWRCLRGAGRPSRRAGRPRPRRAPRRSRRPARTRGCRTRPTRPRARLSSVLLTAIITGAFTRAERAGDLFVARTPALRVHRRRRQRDPPSAMRSPALLDDEFVQRIVARAEHPAGVDERNGAPCHSAGCAMVSRVVPAIGVTMARRVSVMRLNSVDLPTLGRPTSTTVGSRRSVSRDMSESAVSGKLDSVSDDIYDSYTSRGASKHDQGRHRQRGVAASPTSPRSRPRWRWTRCSRRCGSPCSAANGSSCAASGSSR